PDAGLFGSRSEPSPSVARGRGVTRQDRSAAEEPRAARLDAPAGAEPPFLPLTNTDHLQHRSVGTPSAAPQADLQMDRGPVAPEAVNTHSGTLRKQQPGQQHGDGLSGGAMNPQRASLLPRSAHRE